MAKKKRRKRTRVNPSPELLAGLETTVLEEIKGKGGKGYWTHIHDHVTRTLLDDNDPIEKEWLDLSDYGKSKVLKTTLDDLEKRLVLKRKKNFHPYILINVLDRIVIELNKEDESEL